MGFMSGVVTGVALGVHASQRPAAKLDLLTVRDLAHATGRYRHDFTV